MVDAGGLVMTREAPHVVPASVGVVHADVLLVPFLQFGDGLLNVSVGRRNRNMKYESLVLHNAAGSFITSYMK